MIILSLFFQMYTHYRQKVIGNVKFLTPYLKARTLQENRPIISYAIM